MDYKIKNWQKIKKKEWEKNARYWIKIIRENLDPFRLVVTNKAILQSLKGKKKLKILDAGCGEGYLSRILVKKGHRVWGIDISDKLIRAAKDEERRKPLGIKYFVGNFIKTNFPPNFFDFIISHQTINETLFPERVIAEFQRLLKHKGKLVLLFLHPCFGLQEPRLGKKLNVLDYFQKKLLKKKFLVSGLWSPVPDKHIHLPLEKWIEIITKKGFLISQITEPHPPLNLIKKNKWWTEHFKRPMFILIGAIKFKK